MIFKIFFLRASLTLFSTGACLAIGSATVYANDFSILENQLEISVENYKDATSRIGMPIGSSGLLTDPTAPVQQAAALGQILNILQYVDQAAIANPNYCSYSRHFWSIAFSSGAFRFPASTPSYVYISQYCAWYGQ